MDEHSPVSSKKKKKSHKLLPGDVKPVESRFDCINDRNDLEATFASSDNADDILPKNENNIEISRINSIMENRESHDATVKLKKRSYLQHDQNLTSHLFDADQVLPKKKKNSPQEKTSTDVVQTDVLKTSDSIPIPKKSRGNHPKKKKKRRSKDNCDTTVPDEITGESPDSFNETFKEIEKSSHDSDKREAGEENNFTVLGISEFESKAGVECVLPEWLAKPTIISTNLQDLSVEIDSISEISEEIVQILKEKNITHFFPVQSVVIPWLLKSMRIPSVYRPSDICVSAPTGSGKTLAYVIPIIEAIRKRLVPKVRALVILPAQELAIQVYNVFKDYSSQTDLRVILLATATPFDEEQKLLVKSNEFSSEKSLADIVVTTPGRLVSHLQNTPGFSLQYLKYLVIDEADRLIRDLHSDWLFHVETHSVASIKNVTLSVNALQTNQRPPQKLLFSATLSQDSEKLSQLSLFQPKLFTSVIQDCTKYIGKLKVEGEFIGKFTTPLELTEKYCIVDIQNKPLALYCLIIKHGLRPILVFTNSCETTHRLMYLLSFLGHGQFTVNEISANLKPSQRQAVFNDFKTGKISVLICTDSLARGIDIPNVNFVISYDAPTFIKNYIHRVGRTGRAGRFGTAISLLLPTQSVKFLNMLKGCGKNVKEIPLPEKLMSKFNATYQAAMKNLQYKLSKEKKNYGNVLKQQKLGFTHLSIKNKLQWKLKKKKKASKSQSTGAAGTSNTQDII